MKTKHLVWLSLTLVVVLIVLFRKEIKDKVKNFGSSSSGA